MHTSRDMSTHKSIKTSLERAKTSLGLKSYNQERMESVSELMMALESERQLEQVMMNSVEQWTEIVDEITTNMDSATTSESEWKTRFHDQRLFNQMLNQEIGHIKTELYMLKQGDTGMTLPVMGESKSSSSYSRQSQVYINSLEEKLKSLESLYNMYEHQLDDASRDYHRLTEEINKIVKDVSYKQKAMIKRQEESDQRKIAESNLSLKLPEKVTTLPPLKGLGVREKMSYLKLHEVKSVTSKPIDRGEKTQPWKGVGKLSKLPTINNNKINEKTSKKTKETYVVQEEWKRVTKKDLLHPIWSANSNREEDHQSNVTGMGHHVKKNKKTDADPKLPSIRSRRIANLGASSDGVNLPAIRKGRKAKTNQGATKERPDTHKDYVCHVDDQRAGSTEASKDNNLCGLSRRPSTKTPIKTALRNSDRNVSNGENRTVANKSQHKRKLDPVSKSTKKTLPEVVASHQQHNATERHEYQFPVDNDGPISKPSTKRLKSAFVRSNSTSSNDDGKKQNVSPIELQASPSKKDSQISVVYKDSMSPLNLTTDVRVNMAEDTSEIKAGRNSSENFVNSTEKATKDPGTKRKSVTINDKTTIHFP